LTPQGDAPFYDAESVAQQTARVKLPELDPKPQVLVPSLRFLGASVSGLMTTSITSSRSETLDAAPASSRI
jgi:hypothetical protein